MRILVYGINFFPELTGIGKYTGEMCEWLAERGHEVEVITAMPYYPKWQIDEQYGGKGWFMEKHKQVKVFRSPLYVNQNVTALKRIIHELSFFLSSSVYWFPRFFKSYDVIISIYPPLIIGAYPFIYKLFRTKTTWIFHVQDLQVDAARELNLIKNQSLLNFLFKAEKFFLKRATVVSSISRGMMKKILTKGVSKERYLDLPNWVDVNFIRPMEKENSLKAFLGYRPEDKIILYSGNMGEKQGLEMVIYVAEQLKERKDIFFLMAGEGAAKSRLANLVAEKKLDNVIFSSLKPYEELPRFLNMADLHLVIQKKGASDLVLPSKLNTILAVGGVAIINAMKESSLYEVVEEEQIGILAEPENEKALLKAILENIDKDNHEIKAKARAFAVENLNIDSILSGFERELKFLTGRN